MKIFGQKKFGQRTFKGLKKFRAESFWSKNILGPKKILVQRLNASRKFFGPTGFMLKKTQVKISFGSMKYLGSQNFRS